MSEEREGREGMGNWCLFEGKIVGMEKIKNKKKIPRKNSRMIVWIGSENSFTSMKKFP